MSKVDIDKLPSTPSAKPTAASATTKPVAVTYSYTTRIACPGNDPARDTEISCTSALTACQDSGTDGPLHRIYRREHPTDGEPGAWAVIGSTCFPDAVPGTTTRPQLTYAMIHTAWQHTPFAKPAILTQPVGGTTLIGLPTYYQATFPTTGYQPGEINTVTLLGHQVRIRPTFTHHTYTYGDGTTSGPTRSGGGPWPTGDITHTYQQTGTVNISVATTYGGEYSIDGSPWAPIRGTTTITGPTTQLRIAATRNDLVNH